MNHFNGIVYRLDEPKTYGNKGFRKRLLVIQPLDNTETFLPMDVTGSNIELCDDINIGDEIIVEADFNCWPYRKKDTGEEAFFLSLEAKEIRVTDTSSQDEEPVIPF